MFSEEHSLADECLLNGIYVCRVHVYRQMFQAKTELDANTEHQE